MKKLFFLMALFGCFAECPAARLVEPCEVQFTIQDGDIGENLVVEVVFDDKSMLPEKSSFFEAKKSKLIVQEGFHNIRWRIRKKDFGKDSTVYEVFEKKIEIEKLDTVCYIFIRGKQIFLNSNSTWKDRG
jgi:hypothetical protein